MAVDIEVNLDVDIEDELGYIKTQIEALEDRVDLDLGDALDDIDIDLNDEDFDLDLPENKEVDVRVNQHGGVHIPGRRSVHVSVNVDDDDINGLKRRIQEQFEDYEIDVSVDSQSFRGSLGQLGKELNKFEKDRELKIGVDREYFRQQLATLGIDELNAGTSGGSRDSAILAELKGIHREVKDFNRRLGDVDSGPSGGLAEFFESSDADSDKMAVGEMLAGLHRSGAIDLDVGGGGDSDSSSSSSADATRISTKLAETRGFVQNLYGGHAAKVMRAARTGSTAAPDVSDGMEGVTGRAVGGDTANRQSKFKLLAQTFGKVSDAGGELFQKISKLRPTFARVYAIVATLLPSIIGLYAQFAALGTALAGVAAAGGAIAVLGALGGEADTLKGSVADLETQIKSFRQEFFQAIQPAADRYAPQFAMILDEIVNTASGLTDELIGLQVFEGVLLNLIQGGGAGLERLMAGFIGMGGALREVTNYVNGFIATALPDFLLGVAAEGVKSFDSIVRVTGALYQLMRAVYGVIKFVLNFLDTLSALSPFLKLLADVLLSKTAQQLMVILTTLAAGIGIVISFAWAVGVLNSALGYTGGIMAWLSGTVFGALYSSIASAISAIPALISSIMAMNSVLAQTAALTALATGGLATIAGLTALGVGAANVVGDIGSGPSTGGSSGSMPRRQGDTTINVYGDPSEEDMQKMVDVSRGVSHRNNLGNGEFGAPIGG